MDLPAHRVLDAPTLVATALRRGASSREVMSALCRVADYCLASLAAADADVDDALCRSLEQVQRWTLDEASAHQVYASAAELTRAVRLAVRSRPADPRERAARCAGQCVMMLVHLVLRAERGIFAAAAHLPASWAVHALVELGVERREATARVAEVFFRGLGSA